MSDNTATEPDTPTSNKDLARYLVDRVNTTKPGHFDQFSGRYLMVADENGDDHNPDWIKQIEKIARMVARFDTNTGGRHRWVTIEKATPGCDKIINVCGRLDLLRGLPDGDATVDPVLVIPVSLAVLDHGSEGIELAYSITEQIMDVLDQVEHEIATGQWR